MGELLKDGRVGEGYLYWPKPILLSKKKLGEILKIKEWLKNKKINSTNLNPLEAKTEMFTLTNEQAEEFKKTGNITWK